MFSANLHDSKILKGYRSLQLSTATHSIGGVG